MPWCYGMLQSQSGAEGALFAAVGALLGALLAAEVRLQASGCGKAPMLIGSRHGLKRRDGPEPFWTSATRWRRGTVRAAAGIPPT